MEFYTGVGTTLDMPVLGLARVGDVVRDDWINFPWSVLPVVRRSGEPVTPSSEAL
ncbi:hypothetical protein [Streptomyces rishiriensis]|uniref:hypothetical protein n=1 Tax=Streptomyces rishiriensis TaxID=68264 RepID=UPI0037D2A0D1